jgi:ribA/ribD-fused uncharacterized protein
MTPTSVEDLLRTGAGAGFLFFWGHTAPPGAAPGPHVLSQWWPAPFVVEGELFTTAEHYMMWRKARLFGDDATAAAVLEDPSPARAKALGRTVDGFDRSHWAAHRMEVVVSGNRAKFGQHPELGAYLANTGRRVLVEASPQDRIWGIGLAAAHPDAADPARWPGQNLLGFALMQVRAQR